MMIARRVHKDEQEDLFAYVIAWNREQERLDALKESSDNDGR